MSMHTTKSRIEVITSIVGRRFDHDREEYFELCRKLGARNSNAFMHVRSHDVDATPVVVDPVVVDAPTPHVPHKRALFTPVEGIPNFLSGMTELEGKGGAYWRPVVDAATVLATQPGDFGAAMAHAVTYGARFGARTHDVANAVGWVLRKQLRDVTRETINAMALRALRLGKTTLPVAELELLADELEHQVAQYEAQIAIVHQLGGEAVLAFEIPSRDGALGDAKPFENEFDSETFESLSLEEQANQLLRAAGFDAEADGFDDDDESFIEELERDDFVSRRDFDIASAMRAPLPSNDKPTTGTVIDKTTIDKVVWMPVTRGGWVDHYANMGSDELKLAANFAASKLFKERYHSGMAEFAEAMSQVFYVEKGGALPRKPSAALLKLRSKLVSTRFYMHSLYGRIEQAYAEQHRYDTDPAMIVIAAMHNAQLDDEIVELKEKAKEVQAQYDAIEHVLGRMEVLVPYLTWEFPFDIRFTTGFLVDPVDALATDLIYRAQSAGQSLSLPAARSKVKEVMGNPEFEDFTFVNDQGVTINMVRVTYREKHVDAIARGFRTHGDDRGDATTQAETYIAKAIAHARRRVGAMDKAREAVEALAKLGGTFTNLRTEVPETAAEVAAAIVGNLDELF